MAICRYGQRSSCNSAACFAHVRVRVSFLCPSSSGLPDCIPTLKPLTPDAPLPVLQPAADIYSLGVLLFCMLTGERVRGQLRCGPLGVSSSALASLLP